MAVWKGKKWCIIFTFLQQEIIEYLSCVLFDTLVNSENDEKDIHKDKSQIRMMLEYFDLEMKY